MRAKGAVLGAFTLGVGCLLLFVPSGTGTALGVALITLVSTAFVANRTARGPAGRSGRRDPK